MFSLLYVLIEHDLLDKTDQIFNMGETGVELNNSPGSHIYERRKSNALNHIRGKRKDDGNSLLQFSKNFSAST